MPTEAEMQAAVDAEIEAGYQAYAELEAQGLSHEEIVKLWQAFNPGETPALCGP